MSAALLDAPAAADPRSVADCVNPILSATRAVFESMLGCEPRRSGLAIKTTAEARYEVSGVIGITGKITGTIVLSLSPAVAAAAYERLTGGPLEDGPDRDARLSDAVGELTNMIAGGAKARLSKIALSLGIPNVVSGRGHVIHFPTSVPPISMSFDSDLGPFAVEFGFAF